MPKSRKKVSDRASTAPRREIPAFATEQEEREFWLTHDTVDYVDWSAARRLERRDLPVRITRVSSAEHEASECGADVEHLGPAERLAMIWPLSRAAWAFHESIAHADAEPRSSRSALRVRRLRG
jgi:hypothetical protein